MTIELAWRGSEVFGSIGLVHCGLEGSYCVEAEVGGGMGGLVCGAGAKGDEAA